VSGPAAGAGAGGAGLSLRDDGVRPPYLNANVWVVAGPDPQGRPGSAWAAATNWCWARVANEGGEALEATVRFYWCPGGDDLARWEPFLAHPAGSATVRVGPGTAAEVRADQPWTPPEPGIATVLAVASAPGDPAPPGEGALPMDDRHLALYVVHVVPPGSGADAAEGG
jgi:hypothetical protein